MIIDPTDEYVEELCRVFHLAYVQTEEAIESISPLISYKVWEEVPGHMKGPIRIAVRTVLEYIQNDIKVHEHTDGTTHDHETVADVVDQKIEDHFDGSEEVVPSIDDDAEVYRNYDLSVRGGRE